MDKDKDASIKSRSILIMFSAEYQIGQKRGERQQEPQNHKETVTVFSQRDSTDIHAKQANDQIEGQRQHCHACQYKQRAVGLFIDKCGQFFLKEFDALH